MDDYCRFNDRSRLAALQHSFLQHIQAHEQPVCKIAAVEAYLPKTVVDNDELVAMLDCSESLRAILPKVIYRTTGSVTRRHADKGTSPSDLAVKAARRVLEKSRTQCSEIDTLIFAATDTDVIEPATANIVQKKLGIRTVNAFDVGNACNSFLQAINIANSLIASGAARKILITCAEIGSYWANRKIDSMKDLRLKMGGLTLGDAGTAMLLEPSENSWGITEINLLSFGEFYKLCSLPHDVSWRQRAEGAIHGWFSLDMAGLANQIKPLTVSYFKQYQQYRQDLHNEENYGNNVAMFLPHQISKRMIDGLIKAVGVPPERVAVNADTLGNTAANAIPLTLAEEIESGRCSIGSGKELLFYGAASGLALGHIRLTL